MCTGSAGTWGQGRQGHLGRWPQVCVGGPLTILLSGGDRPSSFPHCHPCLDLLGFQFLLPPPPPPPPQLPGLPSWQGGRGVAFISKLKWRPLCREP